MKVLVFGVRANNVVVIFMTAFVGFVTLPSMFKILSFKTFPIIIRNHHHIRSLALIVEIPPMEENLVDYVFVTNVDMLIAYVTSRVLKRLTLVIRVLIIILKTILIILFKVRMSKYHITMVNLFKVRRILK